MEQFSRKLAVTVVNRQQPLARYSSGTSGWRGSSSPVGGVVLTSFMFRIYIPWTEEIDRLPGSDCLRGHANGAVFSEGLECPCRRGYTNIFHVYIYLGQKS